MTLIQKDFELPDGTVGTIDNLGFAPGSAATGGSIVANVAAKAHGATGLQIINGAGTAAVVRFALTAPSETVSTSVVFALTSAPEVDTNLFGLRRAAGNILRFQWRVGSSTFAFLDTVNVIREFVDVTPSANTKYRLTVTGDRAGGSFTAKLYNHATGAQVGATLTATGVNMGAEPFAFVDIGQSTGGTSKTTYYDDLQYNDGSTVELAPMTDPVAPLTPATTAVPVSGVSNTGGWTGSFGDLADTNASTFVESPAAPVTDAAVRYRLGPLVNPSTFSLTVSSQLTTASTSNTAKVRLYQGATLRKEWAFTPTTVAKDQVLTMTAAEIAAVTNWTALDVELSWTGA